MHRLTKLAMTALIVCAAGLGGTSCARVRGYQARRAAGQGEKAVPFLITMLSDQRSYMTGMDNTSSPSSEATLALIRIGTPAVVPLIETLRTSTDSWTRGQAAFILGMIRDPRAIDPLIAALGDEYWLVRSTAACALDRLRDSRALAPLLAATEDSSWNVRYEAARSLEPYKADSRVVEAMVRLTRDDSEHVKQFAIRLLEDANDPRVVETLIAALRDQNPYVRCAAASALGDTGDPGAVEPLIIATGDKHSWVRNNAASALRAFPTDPRVVEALTRLATDQVERVRQTAVQVLRQRERLGGSAAGESHKESQPTTGSSEP